MVILNGGVGGIVKENRTTILMFAHAHCVFYYFQHACGRHRIITEILIKMYFLGLISNAGEENATISV